MSAPLGSRALRNIVPGTVSNAAPPSFNPSSLALQGWWEAPYAGAPWTGTASAGGSAGRNLAAGTAPPTGLALNGNASADFNGTTHVLNGAAWSTYATVAAVSGWVLMQADAVVADPGVGSRFLGNGIFDDSAATFIQLCLTTAGATFAISGTSGYDEATTACSTGTPHLVRWKLDAGKVYVASDSGAWVPGPGTVGNITNITNVLRVGSGFSAFFDGKMWSCGIASYVISDADFTSVKTWLNARYGLAL
jgi:hypothetical protein